MKVFFKNTGLEFVTTPIVSLDLDIETDHYWNTSVSPYRMGAANTYDCLATEINVVGGTDITVKIAVEDSNIKNIALVQINSSGEIIDNDNFNKTDLFTSGGATQTLNSTTTKILLNIPKNTAGATINYTGSWIKGVSLEYDESA